MLGYGFVPVYQKGVKGKYQLVVDILAINRLKEKIKSITCKTIPASFGERISRLNRVLKGWINYFKLANMYGGVRGALRLILTGAVYSIRFSKWTEVLAIYHQEYPGASGMSLYQ